MVICTPKPYLQGYAYMILDELTFFYLTFDATAAVADTASGGMPGKYNFSFSPCCSCANNDIRACMMT